jgi:hypothetical protein|tara:strand:+ start:124 stop:264 length:141 start_codon:yes stop_codon:yes gene_type:complete
MIQQDAAIGMVMPQMTLPLHNTSSSQAPYDIHIEYAAKYTTPPNRT